MAVSWYSPSAVLTPGGVTAGLSDLAQVIASAPERQAQIQRQMEADARAQRDQALQEIQMGAGYSGQDHGLAGIAAQRAADMQMERDQRVQAAKIAQENLELSKRRVSEDERRNQAEEWRQTGRDLMNQDMRNQSDYEQAFQRAEKSGVIDPLYLDNPAFQQVAKVARERMRLDKEEQMAKTARLRQQASISMDKLPYHIQLQVKALLDRKNTVLENITQAESQMALSRDMPEGSMLKRMAEAGAQSGHMELQQLEDSIQRLVSPSGLQPQQTVTQPGPAPRTITPSAGTTPSRVKLDLLDQLP